MEAQSQGSAARSAARRGKAEWSQGMKTREWQTESPSLGGAGPGQVLSRCRI